MNRIVYIWVALLFMMTVSCSRQEAECDQPAQPEEELVQLTVTATLGDESDTKTAVQSNGTSIYWTPGDAINLFYGNRSAGQFTSNITEPVQTADFSGTLSVATGSTEAGMEALAFWGVYPYNENNTCDGMGVTLTIPGTQQGVPGTFADKLNPTVATSPGLGLAFYNVGSWFLFSVTSSDISSATLKGNNNEDLAGKVRVTMDGNGHPVTTVVEGIKSITITPATGDAFVPGELYYIVLRPQTLSAGYTLTMTKTSGASADCIVVKEAEFERSSYRRKREADNGLTFSIPAPDMVDLGLSVKWASCNLGATSPEEYGDYYAWGEIETKSSYSWSTYKWGTGSSSLTKYNNVDNKTQLEEDDDVARVIHGGFWRMPTNEEWDELRAKSTWTWTNNYNNTGIKGVILTSNVKGYMDKSIFLPAAGRWVDAQCRYCGQYCDYWSSNLYNLYDASHIAYRSSSGSMQSVGRYSGLPIRAVYADKIWPESVKLNKYSISISVGDTEQLMETVSPVDVTNKSVVWSSSHPNVATVSENGVVSAVGYGSSMITVETIDGGFTASCTVNVSNGSSVLAIPDAVDLGLSSGIMWASFNLGANCPEQYGDYYAWGELEPYYEEGYAFSSCPVWKGGKSNGYVWPSYKWCNGNQNSLTKYNSDSTFGIVDNKTVLELSDDAAHVKLGGNWRIPTRAEWTELRDNCTWTWMTQNGITGWLAISNNNGESIFLPAAGHRYDSNIWSLGSDGAYWSSSNNTGLSTASWGIEFSSNKINYDHNDNYYGTLRFFGIMIRPVTDSL